LRLRFELGKRCDGELYPVEATVVGRQFPLALAVATLVLPWPLVVVRMVSLALSHAGWRRVAPGVDGWLLGKGLR
jgi:hypothetical protein